MDIENTSPDAGTDTAVNETETTTSVEGEPKKLLLGKRVVRQFNVRTAIVTGTLSTRLRCR